MASALKLGTSTLRSSIAAKPAVQSAAFNGLRAYSTGKAKSLKETFADKLPGELEKVKKLRKEHGNKVIGEVTLDQAYGGARGIKSLVWEVGSQSDVIILA
jgi:citrate synthase